MDRKKSCNHHTRYKSLRDSNAFNTQLGDSHPRGCVYCDSTDHRQHECSKVTDPRERRKIFLRKRLCFNCARDDHRATECRKEQKTVFVLQEKTPQLHL